MISANVNVDETGIDVVTGNVLLRSIKVLQKTGDAPALYLQLYNAASPTVGTTLPTMVLLVPAGLPSSHARTTYDFSNNLGGINFGTALALAVTTTHDGAVGPTAGDEPDVTIDYQTIG
jgi:hypothetical protein